MTRFKTALDLPPQYRKQAEQQLGPAANDPEFQASRPGYQAPRKYRNTPVVVDDVYFPSIAQANRHQDLKLAAAAGAIRGFVSEVSVRLPGKIRMRLDELVNEDFPYPCACCGHANLIPTLVLEDTKGITTKDWDLKRKLLESTLGVKIRIIGGAR